LLFNIFLGSGAGFIFSWSRPGSGGGGRDPVDGSGPAWRGISAGGRFYCLSIGR